MTRKPKRKAKTRHRRRRLSGTDRRSDPEASGGSSSARSNSTTTSAAEQEPRSTRPALRQARGALHAKLQNKGLGVRPSLASGRSQASDALVVVAAPYLELAQESEAGLSQALCEQLLSMAQLAWNAVALGFDSAAALLAEFSPYAPGARPNRFTSMLVDTLMTRRRALFPADNRVLVDLVVTAPVGGELGISVAWQAAQDVRPAQLWPARRAPVGARSASGGSSESSGETADSASPERRAAGGNRPPCPGTLDLFSELDP